jgi:hypothetical protein
LNSSVAVEMDVQYLSIHEVLGLIGLPNDADVELLPAGGLGARAFLTVDRERYCLHLRRCISVGTIIVQQLVTGGQVGEDARVRFDAVFSQTTVGGDNPLLVVEATDTIQRPNLERLADFGDFGFQLKIFDQCPLAARGKKTFEAAVAGLSLALPPRATSSVKTLGAVAFGLEPGTQRPLYSLDPTISVSARVTTFPSGDIINEAAEYAKVLTNDAALESVVRLLSQSLLTSDTLQAFLTAWARLEVLIAKTFEDTYEARFYSPMIDAATSASGPLVNELRKLLKGKYNIRDKFVIVASSVNDADAVEDIKSFKALKKQRDGIHAMRTAPQSLHTDAVQTLLRKYLRLHLKAKA